MLWRVRTTLPDRPGALATLASRLRVRGRQHPGAAGLSRHRPVTDELVLRGAGRLGRRRPRRPGRAVRRHPRSACCPCTDAALVDQPTRYVRRRRAASSPSRRRFPEVVAQLFDAEADASASGLDPAMDGWTRSATSSVQLRRTAPFTADRARPRGGPRRAGERRARRSRPASATPSRQASGDAEPAFEVRERRGRGGRGRHVGRLRPCTVDDERAGTVAELEVDPAWRRRGIGSRLLLETARAAALAERRRAWCGRRRTTRPCCRWCSARACVAGSGWARDDLTVRIPVRRLAGGERPAPRP